MSKIFTLKRHLKTVADRIRHLKTLRKTEPNGFVAGLVDAQFNYRANHIAYCLLRGRSIEEIESSRVTTPPDPALERELQRQVDRVMVEYREEVEHAVPA